MLDIKILRQEPEKIKEALKKRNNDLDITPAIELDAKRRQILADVEEKKATQNAISKKVPQMKKAGEDTTEIFKEMKELSDKIKVLDDEVREIDAQLRDFMLNGTVYFGNRDDEDFYVFTQYDVKKNSKFY